MNTLNQDFICYIPTELLKISNINRWKKKYAEVIDYYYKHYSYFHQERSKILDRLKTSINNNTAAKPLEFDDWNRLVSNQYSITPLSAKGSLLNDPGGRFNIGDIDQYKFQPFPALYIAEDYETAFRERFQKKQNKKYNGLSPEELLLASGSDGGFTNVVLKGKIYQYLDLTSSKTLAAFFNEIKNIKLPRQLKEEANALQVPQMPAIKSLSELRNSILSENWRNLPMQVDIPSNSQILGQIAELSGVEAILYPSIKNSPKKCLAIFPRNFISSSSFVEIQGDIPNEWQNTKLNKNTCMTMF